MPAPPAAPDSDSAPPNWAWLAEQAAAVRAPLLPAQLAQLQEYLRLLREWNARFNLTAIEQPAAVLAKHFLDSLTCALVEDFPARRTLLDVGSGAGFPGLVLKIAFPALEVVLLDSIAKRARFLRRVIAELALPSVTVVEARAEEAGRPGHTPLLREQFEVVTARAVARAAVLAEWMAPFACVGGALLLMKGPAVQEELAAAARAFRLLGCGPPETRVFVLPGTDAGRCLVRIPKVRPTPARYPRPTPEARRDPL